MNPAVKILMKLKKEQLLYKACRYRLVGVNHTKIELAEAIAKYEEKRMLKGMRIIANG